MIDFLVGSDNTVYQDLAKIAVITYPFGHWKDEHLNLLEHGVHVNGTHVYLTSYISEDVKKLGRWHFSQEILEGLMPYSGWLINKKYPLSEQLAKHLLIYQQVC